MVCDRHFVGGGGFGGLDDKSAAGAGGGADVSLFWAVCFGCTEIVVAGDGFFFLREWELKELLGLSMR